MKAETIAAWIAAGSRVGRAFRLRPPRKLRGRNGVLAASGAGASLEFLQHREYHPGDDPRDIDWNASARSDRLVAKLYSREVEPRLDLIIDFSASMGIGDARPAAAATGMAALLGTAAESAGWSVFSWPLADSCSSRLPSVLDPASFPRDAFSRAGNPGRTLIVSPPRFRPGSLRIFLSDLMWPANPAVLLDVLSGSAEAVVIVHILDRGDSRAPDIGRYRLIDVEDQGEMEVDITEEIARRYAEAFNRHRRIWEEEAIRHGALFVEIPSGIESVTGAAEALAAILDPL